MTIQKFNTLEGIFVFELEQIQSLIHSHPALEVILSSENGVDLVIDNNKYLDQSVAIIQPNRNHSVSIKDQRAKIYLIECNTFARHLLNLSNINVSGSHYVSRSKECASVIQSSIQSFINDDERFYLDDRIRQCLSIMNSQSVLYADLLPTLTGEVNLSQSRLSHLFKDQIGVSIKKYHVWTNLKKVFKAVIHDKMTMYDAAFKFGFYDQPHLSRAFKNMLGISPSIAYNSRTVQDLVE